MADKNAKKWFDIEEPQPNKTETERSKLNWNIYILMFTFWLLISNLWLLSFHFLLLTFD